MFRLINSERAKYGSFDGLLTANQTRAFVVSRDDVIVYERYFGGFSATTQLPAFSMSKTFATLLIGCAIEDGLLTDRRLVTYLPELASKPGYDKVTLEHLLRMTSGIWEPIGADQPATWSLDSQSSGIEKFFGGFNATARDYARLGLLFLHGGTLNGRTVVSQEWIDRSLSPASQLASRAERSAQQSCIIAEGKVEELKGEAKQEAAKAGERIKGKVEEITGKAKAIVGAVVDSEQMKLEGKARALKGTARQAGTR